MSGPSILKPGTPEPVKSSTFKPDTYRPATLTALLQQRAGADTRTALRFLHDGSAPVDLTAAQLCARAAHVAAALAEHGVRPGDRVLLMLTTQQDVVELFFGATWSGAVPVPLYPPMFTTRVDDFVARFSAIAKSAQATLLVVADELEAPAQQLAAAAGNTLRVLGVSACAGAGLALPPHHSRADDLALVQYTSGSTGFPKGVALSHANIMANVRAICAATAFGANDVGVSWLPLYHDMGLVGGLLSTLHAGALLVAMSPVAFAKRPVSWLQAISAHRGTLSPAPNFAFRRCLRLHDDELAGLDLSSWRIAFNGAEPVDPVTLQRFAARFAPHGLAATTLFPVYGLAEHTLAVTFPPLLSEPVTDVIDRVALTVHGRAEPVAAARDDAFRCVSVGVALPGVHVRIVLDGQEAPERAVGEIVVKSASVMQGYFNDATATAATLRDGWLYTGDLGYIANGQLFITGRAKDLILKDGRNYYPQDLEAAAFDVDGVRAGRAVAFSVERAVQEADGAAREERVVLVCEVTATADRTTAAARVAAAVAQRVGFRPDEVVLCSGGALPLTSSGKVQRTETKRRYLEGDWPS